MFKIFFYFVLIIAAVRSDISKQYLNAVQNYLSSLNSNLTLNNCEKHLKDLIDSSSRNEEWAIGSESLKIEVA